MEYLEFLEHAKTLLDNYASMKARFSSDSPDPLPILSFIQDEIQAEHNRGLLAQHLSAPTSPVEPR